MARKVNTANFLAQSEQAFVVANNQIKFMVQDNLTDTIQEGSLVVAEGNIFGNIESIEDSNCIIKDFKGIKHEVSLQDVEKVKAEIEF